MFYVEFPMFHVEHRGIMRILVLFLLLGCLFGCNKPNPNPELADEIYQDLHSQAQNTLKEVESEKKKLEGFKKDLESVVPQTGAIKYAQKRYFESEAQVQKLEQLAKYYEIKAADRKRYTSVEYMKAFKSGKPWPTSEEIEAYKQHKESLQTEKGWNTKKRVEEYEKAHGIVSKAPKAPETNAKKEEKPE